MATPVVTMAICGHHIGKGIWKRNLPKVLSKGTLTGGGERNLATRHFRTTEEMDRAIQAMRDRGEKVNVSEWAREGVQAHLPSEHENAVRAVLLGEIRAALDAHDGVDIERWEEYLRTQDTERLKELRRELLSRLKKEE